MAELVLRDARWNAVSLGDNLPFETLAAAIREHRPKLFWLSCLDVAFVVGGYALTDEIRRQMKYSAFCDNMQHLEGFAQTLRSAGEKLLLIDASPAEFKLVDRRTIADDAWAHIAVVENQIFVRELNSIKALTWK